MRKIVLDKQLNKMFNKIIDIVTTASSIYHNQTFVERIDKYKFKEDDVTSNDIKTEEYIKSEFLKLIPNASFIGEEGDNIKGEDFKLIVDPIDGTFNYKHGIGIYGTQLCLLKNNVPIFSCMYIPSLNALYYACESGAYLNHQRITVSDDMALNEMVVSIGDFQQNDYIDKQKLIVGELSSAVKRIRMLGSSLVDSAFLASGSVDVYIVYTTNLWDIIPGAYLIQQAGGVHYTNKDKNISIFGNKNNVDKVIKILGKIDKFTIN